MKRKKLPKLLTVEIILLVLILSFTFFRWWTRYAQKELVREVSPDGRYTVQLLQDGMPAFPFGPDHISVTLFENTFERDSYYRVSFSATVANDGAPAEYEIEWLEDGIKVTLRGREQPEAVYILPFETIE